MKRPSAINPELLDEPKAAADARTIEYQAAVRAVAMCAGILRQYDYAQLLRDIDKAQTVGPFIDPTLYRKSAAAMQQDQKLLSAAAAFLRSDGVRELKVSP
jgi:hypothetical protein